MHRIKKNKHEEILYLLFGICTTAINICTYYCLYNILHLNNIASTILSWLISVVFAFVTNKFYVFKSTTSQKSKLIREISLFFASRVFSGGADILFMFITVDIMLMNSTVCKVTSNIFVIVANYIISKFLIFGNLNSRSQKNTSESSHSHTTTAESI